VEAVVPDPAVAESLLAAFVALECFLAW